MIEKQCLQYKKQNFIDRPVPTPATKTGLDWKVVRVFVSSTFTDFHNEREILVKQVGSKVFAVYAG